jgi:hypothetical protein
MAAILALTVLIGIGIGLYLGVVQGDMWKELYLALGGLALFYVGRLIEPRG